MSKIKTSAPFTFNYFSIDIR